MIEQSATQLRLTDRKRLGAYLQKLGAPDPGTRAAAALAVTELLEAKGLSWRALLPPDGLPAQPPLGWRQQVAGLLEHPSIEPAERIFLTKILGWRSPGADGLARLKMIADRLDVAE